jgi:hypothetical protein
LAEVSKCWSTEPPFDVANRQAGHFIHRNFAAVLRRSVGNA